MLQWLNTIDTSLFLFLNGCHSPFFDGFFYYATKPVSWIPFYLLLIILVVRMYKWKTILILIGVVMVITVSDQAANLSKNNMKRLRPTHEKQLETKTHTVKDYRGGTFGFYSAHASTSFALALFLFLLLHKRHRWVTPLLLAYAAIMAYSRIYLGVHYPGDILAGTAIGLLIGWLFWKLLYLLPPIRDAA